VYRSDSEVMERTIIPHLHHTLHPPRHQLKALKLHPLPSLLMLLLRPTNPLKLHHTLNPLKLLPHLHLNPLSPQLLLRHPPTHLLRSLHPRQNPLSPLLLHLNPTPRHLNLHPLLPPAHRVLHNSTMITITMEGMAVATILVSSQVHLEL
jgi:hypothetical protein